MQPKLDDATLVADVAAYCEHGSQRDAAKARGIAQSTFNYRMTEAKARGLWIEPRGRVDALETKFLPLPPAGKVRRYFLTCVQDYTKLHRPAWENLVALADYYRRQPDSAGAEIMVSTFRYNKEALGQVRAAKRVKDDAEDDKLAFPAEVLAFRCDERVDIAPNLTWCGELQISPTARRPLSGFENYTYRRSTIIPHTTVAMQSVASMPGEGVKLLYTTGCMTQRNYIQRREGFRAEHFHTYGALIVEVTADGTWYCRQLAHGKNGAMHDVDLRAFKGKVEKQPKGGGFVADIGWGDLHAARVDKGVADISWGGRKDSMLEVLRPASQHVHDLLDFSARSHHTRKDPHEVFRRHLNGEWSLTGELQLTAATLYDDLARDWLDTWVVNSNHDRHLIQYLREIDWRDDPENARTVLALNLFILDTIALGSDGNVIEHAIKLGLGTHPLPLKLAGDRRVRFLKEDESHVILPNIDGGIECGLHGDRGVNGAKGTVSGIARVGRRVNMFDKHAAAIMDLTYCGGTSSKLVLGWNHGLSSWTHTHVVTYCNGTRALYGVWKGKWRA